MVGRIMIAKSLILPNITSVTNINKEYVSTFKTMIGKFIWNDKREKVKRETMNKNNLEKNSQTKKLPIGKSFLSTTLTCLGFFVCQLITNDNRNTGSNLHETHDYVFFCTRRL